MPSAAQTYKNVARQTSSPRELEATILLQAAARLQSVHDFWDQKRAQLGDPPPYHRKRWPALPRGDPRSKKPRPKKFGPERRQHRAVRDDPYRHGDERSAPASSRLIDQHQSRDRSSTARTRPGARRSP